MGKSNGMLDERKGFSASQAAEIGKSGVTKKQKKEAVKLFAGEKPKTGMSNNKPNGGDKGKSQFKNKLMSGLGKAKEVSEKIKNLYNKATKRKTISMEMDGKTFKGTEKVGQRSVVKVKNPELGSRKIVDVYTYGGDLKRQRIVDRDASGKKIKVTKQGPDSDILARRAARKNR